VSGNDERRCRVFIKLQKFKYVIIIMFSTCVTACVCFLGVGGKPVEGGKVGEIW